jgi:hypothetical protein
MGKKFLRLFSFVAVSVVLGLALAELVLRLMIPDVTRSSIIQRLTNERPTWARPDAQFHHVGDGIRHLTFPEPLDSEANRVMIVGDSYAMGERVGEEARFGHLLQQHLGHSARVDVLAVTGYSPVIYLNIVRKALSLARYRAVVVSIDQTDPTDELIYEEDVIEAGSQVSFDVARITERDKELNAAYLGLLNRASRMPSLRSFALYNLLRPLSLADYFKPGDKSYLYVKRSLERPQLIGEFTVDPDSERSRKMQALLTKYLDQIVIQCRELKVPLFLFANPWEFETSARPRITLGLPGPFPKENRLENVLASKYGGLDGVHVIPLTRYLREQPNPSSLYVDNPGHEFHWNSQGHAVAEAILRRELLSVVPDLQPKP